MFLWKWLILLTFLAAVLSDEVPEAPKISGSPLKITHDDLLMMIPNQQDKLRTLMEKLVKATEREQVAIVNDFTDDLLVNLNDLLVTNSVDPIPMPDIEESFEWKIWPITYTGEMSLTDGWLQGLSTIERRGDVTVRYEYPNIKIRMPLGIKNLVFDYQYLVKFMGLGPTGGLDGKVDGCKWTLDLDLNLVNLRATMEKYKLDSLGKVSLKFNGNGIVDWMVNIFVSVAIPFVTPVIKLVLQGFIAGGVNLIFGLYNQLVCSILGDCPDPEALLNLISNYASY